MKLRSASNGRPDSRGNEARTKRPRKPHRRDLVAIGVLAGLPVAMFVLPALAGYPVMPGDDLTQSYPLRVLVGAQLRHGHLPLFDPYIWSGAPLLGGWNAGAAYPPTFLFAALPGVAAWTVNMTATWWTAGLGTFAFLRASRLSPVASLLGALSFAFAGAMTAQVPHFGLLAGLSWTPVALLAALRLSQRHGLRARLGWMSALAGAIALVFLAGEPRAIADVAIIVACYAGWRAWRLGRWPAAAAYLAVVLAGVALGVAVGAVQWLPGVEAVATSQRAAHSAALFDSGSLPRTWLLLSLVPDLLGGSGSFGQPAFFATYNLTEVTSYVGLMPVVAACALLGQLRRGRQPEWLIWHLMALLGVVLALGGNTPLGGVLADLPLYGGQRLQSRNMVIADLALAILLAYWADSWLAVPAAPGRPGQLVRRLAGALPGAAAAAVVAAMLTWGAGMLRWLGVSPAAVEHEAALAPWLLPSLALGVLCAALVWWGPRLETGPRTRCLAAFVGADITVFTLLSVVAVAPGLGRPGAPPMAAAGRASSAVVPVRSFTHGGRFAVYDPGLIHGAELAALGAPDANVMSRTPSIQGYGSIVNAAYATATGSHQATGEGQDVLDPRAIGDGTLDQLGATVLVTVPDYLVTPAGAASAEARPGPGFRDLAPGQSTTWYLGSALPVTSVVIPVQTTGGGSRRGVRIGLAEPSGSIRWLPVAPGPGGALRAALATARPAVAVRVAAGPDRISLGPVVVGAAGGARYRADGILQDALVPPRWGFRGSDGPFAIFANSMAKPALTLQAAAHGPTTGAHVRATRGPRFAPAAAQVSSPQGVTVVRAVAGIAGWTAAWRPDGSGAARTLPVRRVGPVQAVTVPAGRGTISWTYHPPGFRRGLLTSLAGLAVLLAAGAVAASPRRRREHDEPTRAKRDLAPTRPAG